jgi:4-alpha-glucanotransferase
MRREDVVAERINDPSNPNQHWCYRMHLTLEELLAAEEFNRKIRAMAKR